MFSLISLSLFLTLWIWNKAFLTCGSSTWTLWSRMLFLVYEEDLIFKFNRVAQGNSNKGSLVQNFITIWQVREQHCYLISWTMNSHVTDSSTCSQKFTTDPTESSPHLHIVSVRYILREYPPIPTFRFDFFCFSFSSCVLHALQILFSLNIDPPNNWWQVHTVKHLIM